MAKKYDHLKEKAKELRLQGLSVGEICNRLKLSKGTVWYWIKNIPLQRKKLKPNHLAASNANKEKHKKLRKEAYESGKSSFKKLSEDPTFRDFVCMYLGEGYRKNKNQVAIGNSNPQIVKLSKKWIIKLSSNKVEYRIQYHQDQDLEKLKDFWSSALEISKDEIKFQRKSNSGKLNGRKWRSEYGILTVRTSDTYLRSKIQAWMDIVQADW